MKSHKIEDYKNYIEVQTSRHANWNDIISPWHEQAIELYIKYFEGKILDIGSRCTAFIQLLRDKGFNAWGLDIMVMKDAEDYLTRGDPQQGLPFADNNFDTITMFHIIEHFYDPSKAMIEIKRILKKDGYIVMAFPGRHETEETIKGFGHYSEWDGIDDMADWLVGRGFEIVEKYRPDGDSNLFIVARNLK